MKELALQHLRALKRADFLLGDAFVADRWLAGASRASVVDPATGEAIASVAMCEAADVDTALDAAAAAFTHWRERLPAERGELLRALASAMQRHARELATLISCEQGKPLAEALQEISYGAHFFSWFAAEGERAYGETIPSHRRASLLHTRTHAVGVAAIITPWNFPSAMIARKAAAALAAGCPVIVKPATETPLSALALARLAQEVGIPAGIFQVVTGEATVLSNALIDDTRVRALSFTGSTQVGRQLLKRAAGTVKRVSMELGGHAPYIVFDDADVVGAAQGAMAAKFATSGQDCLAANRIYVQRDLYEPFLAEFAAQMARLKVGHGLEAGTTIGPMTKPSVANSCRTHIADALAKGARLVVGGGQCALGGNFVGPTLLAEVADEMLIAREETFGPVAAVLPFESEREVVSRANASEMGLAGYVYTTDLRRALRVSDHLEYGMVGVNTAAFTGAPIPFGGWKQSGLGREGSRHGLAEFLELQYVCFGDLAG